MNSNTSVIAVVWIAVAGFLAFLGHGLWDAGNAGERSTQDQAMALARLIEKQTAATFKLADLVLIDAIDHIPPDDFAAARRLSEDRRTRIAAALREHQERLPGIVSMSVTDADGYVFANTVGAPPGSNLADRPYFLELKAGLRDRPAISDALRGRVSKRWGVQLARRVESPDGRFAGMVVANLGLEENFLGFYASLGLADDTTISLRSLDNHVLVRYPAVADVLGKVPPDTPANRALREGSREGVVRSRSGIDGIERYVAYRRLPEYPLVVRVGLSVAEASRHHLRELFAAGLVSLLMVFGAGALTIMLRQRQRQEDEIRDLNANLEARVRQRTMELERANKELEAFSYSASHDLRAPLRSINGYAVLLADEERDKLSADGRHMLERIAHNATRLGDLIDGILDYTRCGRSAMNPGPVDMEALVDTIVDQLRPAYPATEFRRLALPAAHGDATMLHQIWQNLIDNACKYSAGQPAPCVEIGSEGVVAEIAYYVRDNGIGFDLRYADKLFGMFQRLHNDAGIAGTGVGLATVRRLVERHGGHVWATSTPDAGASFFFTLGRSMAADAKALRA